MKEYDEQTKLWNDTFSTCKIVDLTGKELSVEPTFDVCLAIFASQCKKILDYGCGTGDVIFQCAEFGYTEHGIGIDLSQVGIDYANKMAKFNHFDQLEFSVGDITYLKHFEAETFDGIILSNVLDVMPKEVAVSTFRELTRVLKTGGLMFVKLNPYYDEKELEDIGYVKLKDNLYEEDGVLRLRECDTAAWKRAFEKHYEVIRYLEFPYPWQDGMNRLFLIKKLSDHAD